MTSLDATYAYGGTRVQAWALNESTQRVLMALIVLALALMLLLPSPLLAEYTDYAKPGGGNPFFKIHFYSYTLFLALLLVFACMGPVRFVSKQMQSHPGVIQFALVIMLCTAVTVALRGVGGVAYMVDTQFAAPLAAMLVFLLDENRRRKLTTLLIYFVTLNAAVGIVERLANVHLFIGKDFDSEYFRATAFLGHPLHNALITSSMMFVVLAMPWSAWRKATVLSICMAGILAFGARSAFSTTILIGIAAALFFGGRALLRGEMRPSTLAAAPWIAVLAMAVGSALTFGTVLGERIVSLAKFEGSAQARVYAFDIFNSLNVNDILYGVDDRKIGEILELDRNVRILENCWIAILLTLGALLFIVFVLSLLGFLTSIARGRGAIAFFAILNFLLVASTSNSLSVKSPALALFAVALCGIPAAISRRRQASHGVAAAYRVPLRDGVWS
jgi:hypothetical protein